MYMQAKQKEQYDKKHTSGPGLKKGTTVLKKDFLRKKRKGGKLDFKWLGPYTITATLGKGFYSLQSITNSTDIIKRVSGKHLKIYKVPESTNQPKSAAIFSPLTAFSDALSSNSALSHVSSEGKLITDSESCSLFTTLISPVKPVPATESVQKTSSPIHAISQHIEVIRTTM